MAAAHSVLDPLAPATRATVARRPAEGLGELGQWGVQCTAVATCVHALRRFLESLSVYLFFIGQPGNYHYLHDRKVEVLLDFSSLQNY